MARLAYCGHGYGPDALAALAEHLREVFLQPVPPPAIPAQSPGHCRLSTGGLQCR